MTKIAPRENTPQDAKALVSAAAQNAENEPATSAVSKGFFELWWSVVTCRIFTHKNLDWFRHYMGFPYVAMTLYLSVRFLITSQSTLQNDLFWADFNSTSGGIYVANVFNTVLLGRVHERIKLTSPEYAILTVGATKPQLQYSTLYPHIVLYHRLNTIDHAIASLRRKESNLRMLFQQTQFCWVDFNRTFSLAHTEKRALRCLANETTNGAVYLETYLRNFDPVSFLNSWRSSYECGIKAPLEESAEGKVFVNRIESVWNSSSKLSPSEEATYWRSKGITHFTMQWGNLEVPGVTERIEFVSALGVSVNYTIKIVAPLSPGQSTTMKLFWTPVNDIWAVSPNTTKISGMSLVRGTSNFFGDFTTIEQVIIDDGDFPFPLKPKDQLLRDVLGPFGSIDMKHLLYADSLFDLVMNVTRIVNEKLLINPTAQDDLAKLPDKTVPPVFPIAWRPLDSSNQFVWSYLGGNPLCSDGKAVMYALKQLDYTDSCASNIQEGVRVTRLMYVLSFLAFGLPSEDAFTTICEHGLVDTSNINLCVDNLHITSHFISAYLTDEDIQRIQSLVLEARKDVLHLNPTLIQFVVNNTNSNHTELLYQPVLTSDARDPWNFFGWMYAVEWVTGNREVVRLEGDDGSLTLISARIPMGTLEVRGTEIPTSMSIYFLRIVQYSTFISIICASLALFYAIVNKGYIAGINLLKFNRVTGAVWIGRPLLMARGVVAICMMSTSNVLLKLHHKMTIFDETRSAWYNVIIAAGESCWFSYVTADFFVTITQGYTFRYAPMSSLVVQIVDAVIDFIFPFEHTAEIDLQCEMVVFYKDVSCHSGRVVIGSPPRFIMIASLAIGITLLTYITMRGTVPPTEVVQGGKMLLSGIAKEIYVSNGWLHEGRWYLDKASALLTGLVTFRFGRYSRVLDVKTWTLLYLKDNRLYEVEPRTSTSSSRRSSTSLPTDQVSCQPAKELPEKFKYAIALAIGIGGDLKEPGEESGPSRRQSLKTSTSSPEATRIIH